MKSIFPIALLFFAGMSSPAFAGAEHDHDHQPGKKQSAHASASGTPGDPAKVSRTIAVDMDDTMRFAPARIAVKRGETVRFLVKNSGKLKHEMVLGPMKELKKHAALMRKFPEMEHDDPNQVEVDPGKAGEIVWRFSRSGNVDFACLQPGHFEAGMVGKITVTKG